MNRRYRRGHATIRSVATADSSVSISQVAGMDSAERGSGWCAWCYRCVDACRYLLLASPCDALLTNFVLIDCVVLHTGCNCESSVPRQHSLLYLRVSCHNRCSIGCVAGLCVWRIHQSNARRRRIRTVFWALLRIHLVPCVGIRGWYRSRVHHCNDEDSAFHHTCW